MRRALSPLIFAALLLMLLTGVAGAAPERGDAPAAAQQWTGIYVVRQGDTLFSIATRHCMTASELYSLNSSVLTNPNRIYPGMQLRVVNRCGGNPGGGGNVGVCDRGPTQHAQGTVSGNRYFVVRGDTSFSIANRFGLTVTALCQANGINPWNIFAGQTLVIPGLTGSCGACPPGGSCPPPPCGPVWPCPPTPCPPAACPPTPCPPTACPPTPCPPAVCPTPTPPCPPGGNCLPCGPGVNCPIFPCAGWNCPPPPTPRPTVVPVTPAPTAAAAFIRINQPQNNTNQPRTFTVSGVGQGLFEGNVVIQAQTLTGQQVAPQQVTILQGSNVGAGGQGTFSVQLTTNVQTPTPGYIVAFSPQSVAQPAWVYVTFTP